MYNESMMIFENSRRHFFRYEKAEEVPGNESTPNRMLARSAKKTAIAIGDVIWLLRRLGTTSPGRYRFAYAFIVDKETKPIEGLYRFEGRSGLWMPDSPAVSNLDWFPAFLKRMGNGGTSIQELEFIEIEQLRKLYGQPAATPSTNPEALASVAQHQGWPEDSMRYGAIKARRGQTDFRARLLAAYGGKCCISGCRVEALLEAAHIRPHAEAPNYGTRNGLLLRADLHTLYDLHLLGVDEFGGVSLSSEITDLYYKELIAKVRRITAPDKGEDRPSEDDRRARMALFRR